MTFPSHVKIVEVGPRDGLQNETTIIPTAIKIEFVERLVKTGLSVIEATSFVSPKWVPQFHDSDQVYREMHKQPHINYPVLVPNLKGLKRALMAGVTSIAVFTTPSELFSQRNMNCSVAESLEQIHEISLAAHSSKIRVRGYISCVLGCPYEGEIAIKDVLKITESLLALGCYEVSLGDTIGVGTALKTQQLLTALLRSIPAEQLAVHFHDTYGQALTNIYVALELGIATIDSSVAGLGGCPFAHGATGNVASEDVIYLLDGMGIQTGVDLQALVDVGQWISKMLHREPRSKVNVALRNKR